MTADDRSLQQQAIEQLAQQLSPADLAKVVALLGVDLPVATPSRLRHRARRKPVFYRLRVDLDGAKRPIWRRIDVASELHLGEVHAVLQAAFDWGGHHLHEFTSGPDRRDWTAEKFLCDFMVDDGADGTPEWEVRLDQLLHDPGDRLFYSYDFGDGWDHTLRLEHVVDRQPDEPWARVLAGRRAAPPDDCGGIFGYEMMVEALADPDHPEHEPMSDWFEQFGGVYSATDFNPAEFDLEQADADVQSAADR